MKTFLMIAAMTMAMAALPHDASAGMTDLYRPMGGPFPYKPRCTISCGPQKVIDESAQADLYRPIGGPFPKKKGCTNPAGCGPQQ